MKYLEMDVIVAVEVEYDYIEGTKHYFSKQQEQYYPGDAPDVTKVKVLLPVTVNALKKALDQALASNKADGFINVDISESLSETESGSVLEECFLAGKQEE